MDKTISCKNESFCLLKEQLRTVTDCRKLDVTFQSSTKSIFCFDSQYVYLLLWTMLLYFYYCMHVFDAKYLPM